MLDEQRLRYALTERLQELVVICNSNLCIVDLELHLGNLHTTKSYQHCTRAIQ